MLNNHFAKNTCLKSLACNEVMWLKHNPVHLLQFSNYPFDSYPNSGRTSPYFHALDYPSVV